MTGTRLGVLGGTFDPPHHGHLRLARRALAALALDRVLFVPAGDPPHKQNGAITPVTHRLAMLHRALADEPAFVVDRSDVDRPPPHYTSEMLPLIQARRPQAALWLIIGGDSLRDFLSWHRPEAIIAGWRLAVLPRPGAPIDWESLEAALPTIRARVDLLSGSLLDVSSSGIRAAVAAGEAGWEQWLPPGVAAYVRRHRLYQTARQDHGTGTLSTTAGKTGR